MVSADDKSSYCLLEDYQILVKALHYSILKI